MIVKDEHGNVTYTGEDLEKLQAHARDYLEKTRPPEGTPAIATLGTPWAVLCAEHGRVFMTEDEYGRQLSRPDSRWTCPKCGEVSDFDDDNYEAAYAAMEDDA